MLGIYCRISKEKEAGKGESLEDQERLGKELALKLSIDYKVYIDDGLSGASDKIEDRPEFERFLGDVANGTLTHVFALDQSRFERNPQIRFIITNLFKKHNIQYYTDFDGWVDLHDPIAEFYGDMMSIINKMQVTTTKIKVRSALKNRALKGKGQAVMPYGYAKDSEGYIIIDDEEAAIVRRVFEMSLNGIGTNRIAEIFNEEGIPTRYSKTGVGTLTTVNKYTKEQTIKNKKDITWSPNSIRGIIVNPIHKGKKKFKDIFVDVPAIFEEEYWDKVNEHLPLNRMNKGNKSKYEYLLKGLLRCGVCGRNMYGKKREDKHDNHYMCSSKRIKKENCGNRSINIDNLDNFIWKKLIWKGGFMEQLHKELGGTDSKKKVVEIQKKLELNIKKIEILEKKNQDAVELALENPVAREYLSNTLDKNKKEISQIKEEISYLKESQKLAENTVHVLLKYQNLHVHIKENEVFEMKKKVVNDFIKNITINYNEHEKEYIINIEYKVNIDDENYKTDAIPLQKKEVFKRYAKKIEKSVYKESNTNTPLTLVQGM